MEGIGEISLSKERKRHQTVKKKKLNGGAQDGRHGHGRKYGPEQKLSWTTFTGFKW